MMEQRENCRQLLEQVPESGLDELEDILRDLIEFYTAYDNYVPAPKPEVKTIYSRIERDEKWRAGR